MIKTICKFCGKEFKSYPSDNRKFCSKSCSSKSREPNKHSQWKGGQIKKICKNCGEEFKDWPSGKLQYCSKECHYDNYRKRTNIKKSCEVCGKFFYVKRGKEKWKARKYCSRKCSQISQTKKVIKICDICGNKYEIFRYQKNNRTFCSNECKNVFMSEKFTGENHPMWKGGYSINNIPMYNTYAHQISFCEQVRRNKEDQNILEVKCAYCGKWFIPKLKNVDNRIQALNGHVKGEGKFYCSTKCKQECPIYHKIKWPKDFKPATSREVQPELRQMCLERDNYICQKCGKTQDELDVGLHCHHIEGIRWEPLESADLDMVITFCKNCHIEVHKQPDCGYHDLMCK